MRCSGQITRQLCAVIGFVQKRYVLVNIIIIIIFFILHIFYFIQHVRLIQINEAVRKLNQ